VEVLIDGESALPRIAAAIRRARRHVHLTGWFVSPDFVLEDGRRPVVLRNLLAEVAERADVRLLLWAGSPAPVFQPSRRTVRRVRDDLVSAGPIRCALDSRERPMHCHHEKSVIVDDEVAFVGGIDLTAFSGDRRDSSLHPPAPLWDGTTPRPRSAARWWPTSQRTSRCAGVR
jgi:phosphatidylserine/phosphatidylglycerophosphate/cardiolipin synthase-like enzyme